MTGKVVEKRRDFRAPSTLPVVLENATGTLRDISASGAFFWTQGIFAPGDSISFAIELESSGNRVLWKCEGDIVRTERRGPNVGIGVRITRNEVEQIYPMPRSYTSCLWSRLTW